MGVPLIARIIMSNQPHAPHLRRVEGQRCAAHPSLGIILTSSVSAQSVTVSFHILLILAIADDAMSPSVKS